MPNLGLFSGMSKQCEIETGASLKYESGDIFSFIPTFGHYYGPCKIEGDPFYTITYILITFSVYCRES